MANQLLELIRLRLISLSAEIGSLLRKSRKRKQGVLLLAQRVSEWHGHSDAPGRRPPACLEREYNII